MNHADFRLLRLGLVLAGGGARVRRLVARLPSAEVGFEALANIGAPRALLAAADRLAASEAPEVIRRISDIGWRWVVPGDGDYPELLGTSSDPPLGLFVRGELRRSPSVAIVGARRATPYGLQVARLLGEELGRGGVVVVSGMARGVDEAAHRGCLEVGGSSWAVWGAGPDRIYPPEHARLANELAATGALVTEYPPGTPPRRHHFPERNRVIAALTAAVVVVEAAARSGALITARLANEEGREVLAVPGNIFSKLSVGPNTLLRVGARPLLTPRDLFDAIGCEAPPPVREAEGRGLLRFIAPGEAVTADEIAGRASLEVSAVLAALVAHELAGEVVREQDGRFALVHVRGSGG